MRVMAVDLGKKRIGLALSDPLGKIASPLTVLEASGEPDADAQHVARLAREHGVGRIVVGLPRTLRGREEQAAREASEFAQQLEKISGLPVVLWDERLTTAQAERAMMEAGVSSRQRRGHVDKVAAAVILQSYLDAHHGQVEAKTPNRNVDA